MHRRGESRVRSSREIGGMLIEWGIVNTLHEGKPAAEKGER
jgi:hypothetical protein